jgi:2'-5' RNA ligase
MKKVKYMNNKKIFQVSADFELDKKPGWLDYFRSKYDKPYSYHVTLKNSSYFNENDLEKIKEALVAIAKKHRELKVVFNKLFLSNSPKGECVMIEAEPNEELNKLQKEISSKLLKHGEHILEEYKEYENNFRPHITIARYLTPDQAEIAKKELGDDMHCEALIDKLVLTTANNDEYEEWSNPENETHIKLKK